MNQVKTFHQHQSLQTIKQAVSNLLVPSLSPLIRVFIEEKADIHAQRAAIHQQMHALRIEGYDAATRLMLLDAKTQGSYIENIQQQGGDNNG